LINLGMAHYRLGAIEDAKTAMRHVLALSPRHPVAAANLAAFMRLTGEGERAEILLLDLRRGTRITDRGRGATALAATAITGRNN
jgi:Flp pilus assembly protein TadD